MLAGCQRYRASWPGGPTIEVLRIGTDAKVGAIEFEPQTGKLRVENLDSTATLAHELAGLAREAIDAAPGSP